MLCYGMIRQLQGAWFIWTNDEVTANLSCIASKGCTASEFVIVSSLSSKFEATEDKQTWAS